MIADGGNDDDAITVVTMFPDPDRIDRTDDDDHTDDDDDSFFDDELSCDDATVPHPWDTLSTAVRYDLEHPPHNDEFYNALEVAAPVTIYKEIEFFDPIDPPLPSPVWFHPRPPHWLYNWTSSAYRWAKTGLFWASTFFGLGCPFHCLSATAVASYSPSSQSYCCSCVSQNLDAMTSCLMIGLDAFKGHVPPFPFPTPISFITQAVSCGQASFDRIRRLDELVVLNTERFVQYHAWQHRLIKQTLDARSPSPTLVAEITASEPAGSTENNSSDIKDDAATFDPFAVHELTNDVTIVDCIHRTAEEELSFDTEQAANGPTAVRQGLSSTAFQVIATDPYAFMSIGGGTRKPVIFDTGASLGITYDKADFYGPLTVPEGDLCLGGMAKGLKIEGIGPVSWSFQNPNGSDVQIRSQCYYVPETKARLISPQRLFNKRKGVTGKFEGNEDTFTLHFDGGHQLIVDYDHRNHLPIGYALVGDNFSPSINPEANLTLFGDTNQNVTAGHCLFMNWHSRFGHWNCPAAQRILRQFPFVSVKFAAASKCDFDRFSLRNLSVC